MTGLKPSDPDGIWWPLALSTLAGLSTSIGGAIAIMRKPSTGMMAGLLGVAIGVMATVSLVELIIRNALENDGFLVCAAAVGGGLAYYVLEPLFPKVDHEDMVVKKGDSGAAEDQAVVVVNGERESCSSDSDPDGRLSKNMSQRKRAGGGGGNGSGAGASPAARPDTRWGLISGSATLAADTGNEASMPEGSGSAVPRASGGGAAGRPGSTGGAVSSTHTDTSLGTGSQSGQQQQQSGSTLMDQLDQQHSGAAPGSKGSLLRLGLLMAVTMTLHNLPEGFAVAFSAYTSFGPVMALAIALHNIPEGVIIAAPIYAGTGSRWKALGLATASGLSEPLGAVLALAALHPFITPERLTYLLASVGGLMIAVCLIELWPEARGCKDDRALVIGMAAGALVMGWTLAVEGA